MRINGKDMAQHYGAQLAADSAALPKKRVLRVFVLSHAKATDQFIRIKKRVGESVGVSIDVLELPDSTTTEILIDHIKRAVHEVDGIIVQLPLPVHIDTQKIWAALPASHDVDCLGDEAEHLLAAGTHSILPPVVAAFEYILSENTIDVAGKRVVVVGRGKLVGAPAARWFEQQGAHVEVLDKDTVDGTSYLKEADIIALGAGAPHMLKPDMIKEGVVILDAGTSESSGKVVGDAHPDCEVKAALMTPVPGGVGPVAVMMIFKNLYILARNISNTP